MTLNDLALGQAALVSSVDLAEPVTLRLMEMGLVPGAPVALKKRAPFGGPIELKVGGYLLSIRAEQARAFRVEPLE